MAVEFDSHTLISYSRERIRNELLELLRETFRKRGLVLDLENSAFGIYVINLLSILGFDTLFYSNFLYGESSLVTANLSSSIYNWATYIDYLPQFATPAKTVLTFYFPYDDLFTTNILPYEHTFSTSTNIPFTVLKPVEIINTGTNIEIREIDPDTNTYILKPYDILYTETGVKVFSFSLDAQNLYKVEYIFSVPPLRRFELYDIPITLKEGEQLVDVKLFVDGVEWTRKPLVLALPDEKVFDVYYHTTQNTIVIRTGNDIFGKQLEGDEILIQLYLCNGTDANVQPHTITKGPMLLTPMGSVVQYWVTNFVEAKGGTNQETPYEIKSRAPISLRRRYRNVTYYDFRDDLLSYNFVDQVDVVLKRSDTVANDVYFYVLLKDVSSDGRYVYARTSTITVNRQFLSSNYEKDDVILPYRTVLRSIAGFDSGVEYYSPFLIIIDYDTDTWYAYFEETQKEIPVKQYYSVLDQLETLSTTLDTIVRQVQVSLLKLVYDVDPLEQKLHLNVFSSLVIPAEYKIRMAVTLRFKNGEELSDTIEVDGEFTGQREDCFTFNISLRKLKDVNQVRIDYTLVVPPNTNTMLFSSYTAPGNFLRNFIDYGWVIYDEDTRNTYIVDIPVIEKNYFDSLEKNEKLNLNQLLMTIYSTSFNDEKKRLLNTMPHLRFIRSCGVVYNLHYSKPDVYAHRVVYSKQEADSLNLDYGQHILLSDPMDSNDPWSQHAGSIVTYLGRDPDGVRLYSFRKPAQSTIAKLPNDFRSYVLVDTRWIPIGENLNLEIEIEVYVDDPSLPLLKKKYEEFVLDYINKKQVEETIRFSDLVKELYSVQGTRFVRIVKPKHDFVYNYDRKLLLKSNDKQIFLTYVPEKLFTTPDKITIRIKSVYDHV